MTTIARGPDLDGDRARRVGLRRLGGPVATAAAIGAATVALHLRDPHQHGSWGLCPLRALTGWDCPACGGLRAVNDLGNGRLLDAAHSNLLFVASIPLLVALWALWLRRCWTGGPRRRLSPRTARVLGVGGTALALAFTVYRNTPWGSGWYA